MNRRSLSLAFGLLVLSPLLGGCESLPRRARQSEEKSEAEEPLDARSEVQTDSRKVLDVSSGKPRPFFKSTRLPSGLSDEAREIENSLGVQ